MEGWRSGDLASEEAHNKLDQTKEKKKSLESEKQKKNFNEVEFALYNLLKDEYDNFLTGTEEAEEIAKAIGEDVEDFSLAGNLLQIKDKLRGKLIKILARRGKNNLAKDSSFLEDAIDYIVKNKRD